MRMLFVVFALFLLAGCVGVPPATQQTATEPPVHPAHSSRISLDWSGTYVRTLPCADCSGVEERLTLQTDGRYQLQTRLLKPGAEAIQLDGHFEWTYDGNHIQLDAPSKHAFYAVQENRLLQRNADGSWPRDQKLAQMTMHKVN